MQLSASALTLYVAAMSVLGAALMGWDKFRARTGGWRVPEKTLFGVALLGGGLGIWAGMRLFRHKTRHPQFSLGVPIIVVLQAAAVYFLR